MGVDCNKMTSESDTTYRSDGEDAGEVAREVRADYEEVVDCVKVMYYKNGNS